jgi:acetylornithine deacetylase/succinyl-diaminopimelate desuccinylase-like protein
VKNLKLNLYSEAGRTPTIFVEIGGSSEKTILMYGHFDKQPHMTGWTEGLSPIDPKIVDDKLYGRGGADDGYAAYSAILSIKAL